jgi:hypothetical protein
VRFSGPVRDLLDLAHAHTLRDAYMRVTAGARAEAA